MFKPTWVQVGEDGSRDISSYYNITCKSIPFTPFPDLKELPKREWFDQQGDDEFIPLNPVFKAYEITTPMAFIGKLDDARDSIYSFLQYLQGAEFSIYDEFKKKGVRCRYMSYTDDAFYRRDRDIVSFSVKLKVNNPLTYGVELIDGNFSAVAGCDLTIYWCDGTHNDYLNGAQISKVDSECKFAIVAPSKLWLTTGLDYHYPSPRLLTDNYLLLLTPMGVRYVQQ